MNEDNKTNPAEQEPRPADQAAPAGNGGRDDNGGQAASDAPQADPAEELRAENSELRDRLLRAIAETENLRKRAEREVRDAGQYAISAFARDILSIGDNMRRALESVSQEERAAAGSALTSLLEGVEMTERELLNVLERHGVRRVDPAGERFDPNLHQAMLEIEDATVPAGTVTQVMQAGFTINGRVLRPAMVAVAKGGPKPAPRAADGANGGEAHAGASVDRTA